MLTKIDGVHFDARADQRKKFHNDKDLFQRPDVIVKEMKKKKTAANGTRLEKTRFGDKNANEKHAAGRRRPRRPWLR